MSGRGDERIDDELHGHPTLWVPPGVSPSPIRPSRKLEPAHIPLERGGAAATASSLLRELERS